MNKHVSGQRDRKSVCLIAPVPPFRGGIAKYCYSLAKELEKRHELLLLSYKRLYPEILYGKKSQVDPDIDKAEILGEFNRLTYEIDSVNIGSWVETVRTIAGFNPDAVILPWWVTYWAPMYLYLLHSLKKKNIRVIFICINIFEHEDNTVKKCLTKFILRRVNEVIVHSELEKIKLLELNRNATVRKHLLPLFEYDSSTESRRDNAFHLLFFGFIRPYKGLDTLLNAIGILRDSAVSLEIVGEFWNDKEEYLRLIENLGISDKVTIVDKYVPDHEMSHCFSRADLVVLPYRKSITSGVIATAYGFRKPVLATNIGGFTEVIRDGFTGKVVPPDDPHALADGILWFMANKHIDFSENIATFASQNMSWESLVDGIEELIGP
jgi:glycosyltransferase involved in cell wall biosynthesis